MSRKYEILGLAGLSGVLTLALATAEARDIKVNRGAAPPPVAVAEAPLAQEEKAEVGQAAAEQIVEAPACGRKVKVVYSGYGESNRASCPQPAR